MCNFTDFKD